MTHVLLDGNIVFNSCGYLPSVAVNTSPNQRYYMFVSIYTSCYNKKTTRYIRHSNQDRYHY